MREGTKAHVIDGPVEANGFTWWKLDNFNPQDPSASGWSAGQFWPLSLHPKICRTGGLCDAGLEDTIPS